MRLSASFSPSDLDDALSGPLEELPASAYDGLIGAALSVNNIFPREAAAPLATRFKRSVDMRVDLEQAVTSLLLNVPTPLLGVVFSKVVLPSFELVDFDSSIESLNLTHLTNRPQKTKLVTAIGALGAQLGWPTWTDFYEQERQSAESLSKVKMLPVMSAVEVSLSLSHLE